MSSQHVVTAAHCIVSQAGYSLSSIRLGQTDLSQPVEAPGVEVEVDKVIRHPRFATEPVAVRDIAIVKLLRPVEFSKNLKPICLFSNQVELVENPLDEFRVAGWGRTEKARSSDVLQFTHLKSVKRKECQREYTRAEKEGRLGQVSDFRILSGQLCAQGNITDSCSGDSGGPLMSQFGNTWFLAGVVSFGTQHCDSSLPGVYTRVSSFYPWLSKVLKSI